MSNAPPHPATPPRDPAPPVRELIARLELRPHPEGGYFRETYRDGQELTVQRRGGTVTRSASTAIYYLLEQGDMSALHRIASDEVWHHYAGGPLTVHVLHPPEGDRGPRHEALRLGMDLAAGERPQAVVPKGAWFGARLEGPEAFALVGCTVAPGFDFADFEMGEREALRDAFPEHAALVQTLTRAE
ncbi:MAG: cupin domain-containing protein [Polyangiales bacterium]